MPIFRQGFILTAGRLTRLKVLLSERSTHSAFICFVLPVFPGLLTYSEQCAVSVGLVLRLSPLPFPRFRMCSQQCAVSVDLVLRLSPLPFPRFRTCSQQCAVYRRPQAAIGEFNSTCFCADGFHFSEHSKTKGCKADGECYIGQGWAAGSTLSWAVSAGCQRKGRRRKLPIIGKHVLCLFGLPGELTRA